MTEYRIVRGSSRWARGYYLTQELYQARFLGIPLWKYWRDTGNAFNLYSDAVKMIEVFKKQKLGVPL